MQAVLDDAAYAVAQGIGNPWRQFDVERVALGGGVGSRPECRGAVKAAVRDLPTVLRCDVVSARTGTEAGLIGVAGLVMKKYFT